ncbi:hypothetical protein GCM10025868_06790 [Angustibacter aerolatus]|uniref:Penicillin-binding protein dimerisation domain-containing protein n=1 Tax=Angustibacter aerolatus TaxID=1162965 RepID=A0ABQ6JE59_9ACTN|nr:hypothetical protein GCM10025868_06790 [Angustibacter aerolatus]
MFLGVCLVLSLFAVRLLRLQGLDASAMAKQALDGRLTTATVPAMRGDVVDRDGAVLATSLVRYDVTVDQKARGEPGRCCARTRSRASGSTSPSASRGRWPRWRRC